MEFSGRKETIDERVTIFIELKNQGSRCPP